MWQDGIHPILFAELSCVCMAKFSSCSSIHFSGKSTIFGFFKIQNQMWPYRYAYEVPLGTLILNIYGFVGLAPFYFLAKVPVFSLFLNTERGVAI